jgi:hypothetical protein
MASLKEQLVELFEDLVCQRAEDARMDCSYSKPTEEAKKRLDAFLETVEVVQKPYFNDQS